MDALMTVFSKVLIQDLTDFNARHINPKELMITL